MVSKRRDDLRDYMGDEFEFIATIETSDYKRKRKIRKRRNNRHPKY